MSILIFAAAVAAFPMSAAPSSASCPGCMPPPVIVVSGRPQRDPVYGRLDVRRILAGLPVAGLDLHGDAEPAPPPPPDVSETCRRAKEIGADCCPHAAMWGGFGRADPMPHGRIN